MSKRYFLSYPFIRLDTMSKRYFLSHFFNRLK